MPFIRILIVEDYEPFRRFLRLALALKTEFKVFEVSDGLDAVQTAEELQPDVVLLDIGLPKLNGIEAARRIRRVAPNAKLLFVSLESSPDVIEETVRVGGHGYIHKSSAHADLVPAIEAVLAGERFVRSDLEFSVGTKTRVPRDHAIKLHKSASLKPIEPPSHSSQVKVGTTPDKSRYR